MIFNLLITGVFFFFIFGEILRFDLGNNIYLKPLDALVVFSAFVFWILYFLKRVRLPNSEIAKPLVIFNSIALFSLIINSYLLDQKALLSAFLYWLRFASFTTIYFLILITDKKYLKIVPKYLFVSGIIILTLGLVQYLLYPNLQNLYYLGWDEHTYRLFSVFLDPNFAGSILSLFLFFALGAIMYFQKKRNKNHLLIVGIVVLLTSVSIFLTYSRSAILMFIIGVVAYLVSIKRKVFLVFLIAFIAFGVILTLPGVGREGTNLFRTTSTLARLDSYDNAVKIIKDKPILGVGFNAYRSAQAKRGYFDNLVRYPKNSGGGVDSSLLFVAATTGIIGLLSYLYLWFAILKKALKLYRRENNVFALVVICSAAGLSVNSLFINSLFYPSIMLWMWVMIGLMERENTIQH